MTNKNILNLLLSSLGIALAVALYYNLQNEQSRYELANFSNPLYEKYKTLAVPLNLDVSFTQTVQRGRIRNLAQLEFFSQAPKSYDVLILGDSSSWWGFVPQVIEKITGRKVGLFAFEGIHPKANVIAAFNKFADYYLKKDGVVIIAFIEPALSGRAQTQMLEYKDWFDKIKNLTADEFANYVQTVRLSQAATPMKTTNALYDHYLSYRKRYENIVSDLKMHFLLRLPDLHFYRNSLEPLVNPEWHTLKNSTRKQDQISWDLRSVAIYKDQVTVSSLPSYYREINEFKTADSPPIQKGIAENLKTIPFKKIFLVHLSTEENYYRRMRSIYANDYQGFAQLMDFGNLHPKTSVFPMESTTHMANETGFIASIWMAEWLLKN